MPFCQYCGDDKIGACDRFNVARQCPSHDVSLVRRELTAMRDVGMRVPDKAFDYLTKNSGDIAEYLTNMTHSDVADLVVQLSEI